MAGVASSPGYRSLACLRPRTSSLTAINAATRRSVTAYASRPCTRAAHNHNQLWIDPDVVIHIAEAVLEQHNGPTLEQATKGFHVQRIHLPRHTEDGPSRDYLAKRFEIFERTA